MRQKKAEEKIWKEQCFIRAKQSPTSCRTVPGYGDQQEMEKIARLLQVDEFHLFDTKGNLYMDPSPNILALTLTPGSKCSFSYQC